MSIFQESKGQTASGRRLEIVSSQREERGRAAERQPFPKVMENGSLGLRDVRS